MYGQGANSYVVGFMYETYLCTNLNTTFASSRFLNHCLLIFYFYALVNNPLITRLTSVIKILIWKPA